MKSPLDEINSRINHTGKEKIIELEGITMKQRKKKSTYILVFFIPWRDSGQEKVKELRSSN